MHFLRKFPGGEYALFQNLDQLPAHGDLPLPGATRLPVLHGSSVLEPFCVSFLPSFCIPNNPPMVSTTFPAAFPPNSTIFFPASNTRSPTVTGAVTTSRPTSRANRSLSRTICGFIRSPLMSKVKDGHPRRDRSVRVLTRFRTGMDARRETEGVSTTKVPSTV